MRFRRKPIGSIEFLRKLDYFSEIFDHFDYRHRIGQSQHGRRTDRFLRTSLTAPPDFCLLCGIRYCQVGGSGKASRSHGGSKSQRVARFSKAADQYAYPARNHAASEHPGRVPALSGRRTLRQLLPSTGRCSIRTGNRSFPPNASTLSSR